MVNKIFCASLSGIYTNIIEVEGTFVRGLPSFNITGLANSSIQESKHRVGSALANINFSLPPLKLNINLSPSDIPKSGSHFDLAIALLIMANKSLINTDEWFAFGELGLDGSIKHSSLIYPIILDVSLKKPNAKIILPYSIKELFSYVPDLDIYYAKNLEEAFSIIKGEIEHKKQELKELSFKYIHVGKEKYYYEDSFALDFSEVKGQENAIRAGIIACSGFHNLLLEGSPGCGKSMIAKRLQYILPPLSLKEMIEGVKLLAFEHKQAFYKPLRSFRSPHQSSSKSSIIGSATQNEVKPGEIALADGGILFLDELPYFNKEILEALREPLENNKLVVSRVHAKIEYNTSFLFIGALNPCPCGNLFSSYKECICRDNEIANYKKKLSEPFLDRMDLYVRMSEVDAFSSLKASYSSKQIQELVFNAFKMQKLRGQKELNGKLQEKDVDKYCLLDSACSSLLEKASMSFKLSNRAVQRVKKISRTIADLSSSDNIKQDHMLEALSFRRI